MKRIVVDVQPFTYEQVVYVLEDDALVLKVTTVFADLAVRLLQLSHLEDAEVIVLDGDLHFTEKIKQEVEQHEMTMYGENTLSIKLQ